MSSSRRRTIGFLATIAVALLVFTLAQRENADDPGSSSSHPPASDLEQVQTTVPPTIELPEDDLRSALTDVCSSTAAEPADSAWTQEEIQRQIGAFNEQKRVLSKSLAASSVAEHLHVAAMLEDDPTRRFELLDDAVSQSPSDPFLMWGAVHICSQSIETTPCPLQEWERTLVAVDRQNSEAWIRVAANKYAASEYGAALEALRYASSAAVSNSYWTETIEMIERGIAAAGDFGFPERASMAFGIAASELPRYGDYTRMCEERSANSVDWSYACLAYGELVESQGKTEIDVSIARDIQRLALESLGEVERAAEVQQRIDARRQERLDSFKDYDPNVERLIFSNSNLFTAYLAAIRSVGEEAAWRQMTKEIERLIEQWPELACDHSGTPQ
jgi:hypothetical protein